MDQFGKTIMIIGFSVMILGAILWLGGKVPGIGKLPGDIIIKRGNFTFYFPLATSILLSVILSVILALFRRR
jgi:hypothetical protein